LITGQKAKGERRKEKGERRGRRGEREMGREGEEVKIPSWESPDSYREGWVLSKELIIRENA